MGGATPEAGGRLDTVDCPLVEISFKLAPSELVPPCSMLRDPTRDPDCPAPHMIKNSVPPTAAFNSRIPRNIRARTLRKPLPAYATPPAKARRGNVPAVNIVPAPSKAPRIKMPRLATVGEAFALIGRSGLTHLNANEICVRVGRDKEGIHQLRVSVRRLRSALVLFRDLIPDSERRHIASRLKWIAKQCAEAREWDVFQDELLIPLRHAHPDDPALEDFADEVDKLRRAADARVADMLARTQYAKNIIKIETWWNGGGWRKPATTLAAEKAVDFSRARIRKLHQRLCKLGKRVGELDETGLHKLRIRTKKLRYAIDFFSDLFPSKAARAYRTVLAEIQDCLGALNDTVVARQLLAAVGKRAPGLDPATFARAADVITEWNTAKREAGLEQLPGSWRRFADLRPFWK